MADIESLVRTSFMAYETKRREDIEAILSDDFTFSSPVDDHIDRATYFKKCWPNSEKHKAFNIEHLFVKGNDAFVLYEAELKDGKRFRNTEFFQTDGQKIREVQVYFGWDTKPSPK